jgi:quaternary ammonium compound-resistance protein SugE
MRVRTLAAVLLTGALALTACGKEGSPTDQPAPAGLFEVAWAVGMKYTEGFTRFWPSVLTIIGIVISMTLLALAVRTIPVGTGYAIWTGIGAAGTAALGIILFSEPATAWRLFFLLLIVVGAIGLKFSTP